MILLVPTQIQVVTTRHLYFIKLCHRSWCFRFRHRSKSWLQDTCTSLSCVIVHDAFGSDTDPSRNYKTLKVTAYWHMIILSVSSCRKKSSAHENSVLTTGSEQSSSSCRCLTLVFHKIVPSFMILLVPTQIQVVTTRHLYFIKLCPRSWSFWFRHRSKR